MLFTIKPYAYSNTMVCTRGQHIKFFTPLYSDDNDIIVVGNGDVVVVVVVSSFVNSSLFFLDDHLSIKVFYHKQITFITSI